MEAIHRTFTLCDLPLIERVNILAAALGMEMIRGSISRNQTDLTAIMEDGSRVEFRLITEKETITRERLDASKQTP